jgi:ABC-type transport system involved in multi-copper enzyme maturation permease subunit
VPVFDRRYRSYAGARHGARANLWTLARFALRQLFDSKLTLVLAAAIGLVPFGYAGFIYFANNLDVLQAAGIGANMALVGKSTFFYFLSVQTGLAFLFAAFVGPALVGPDFGHGALPLYLSRPISRTGYVLGKLLALVLPLSLATWVPGLLLVGLETALDPAWLAANGRVPVAIFVGSWIWIVFVSLLVLAVASWIRWRPVATGAVFGIFVIGEAFSAAINSFLDTKWGTIFSLDDLVQMIWVDLMGGVSIFGRPVFEQPLPSLVRWTVIGLVSAAAFALFRAKVRGAEVSR